MFQGNIKQSSAVQHIVFLMIDSTAHIDGKTGLSPTVTISKNSAAFASPAGAISEISSGWYKLAANATDSNTLGPLALHATGTGADPLDIVVAQIVAYDPQDTVRLGLTAMPNVASGSAGAIVTQGTGTAQISVSGGLVALLTAESNMLRSSTLQAGGTTTTAVLDASASALDDFYNGAAIKVYSGTGVSQVRTIIDYDGTTKTVTVDHVWVAPGIGGYVITYDQCPALGADAVAKANLSQILGTAITETAGLLAAAFTKFFNKTSPTGTINSLPDAVAGAASGVAIVGSAMTLASGSITAAVVATDAIDADALAADAVTEIQSGLATAAALNTVDDFLDTEVAAIKAKTDLIPASPAAVGSAMTLATDAITAAVIATDAIDADALKADAVTEIQAGLATAAALTVVDDFLDTEIAAIKAKTDLIPAVPSSTGDAMTLTSGERNSVADALLDRSAGIETGYTLRQAQRLMLAAQVGKVSGASGPTTTIRDVNDTVDRIVASVNAGNRTAVTKNTT